MKTKSKNLKANKLIVPNKNTPTNEKEMALIREKLEKLGLFEKTFKKAVKKLLSDWFADVVIVGEYLTRMKAIKGRGNYLSWLVTNFPLTRRTASNYMAIYNKEELVQEAIQMGTVAHMKGAYAMATRAIRVEKVVNDTTTKTVDVKTEIVLPKPLLIMDKTPSLSPPSTTASASNKAPVSKAKLVAKSNSVQINQEVAKPLKKLATPLLSEDVCQPVLILCGEEPFIAQMLVAAKESGENYLHQVVRKGESTLNACRRSSS